MFTPKRLKEIGVETMFEKEAKSYAEDFEKEYHTVYGALLDAFQDGAEFGFYNKAMANEWHKQDTYDIYDLISKDWDIKYFICIMKDKSLVTATGNCDEGCNGEVSVNLAFDYNDEKYLMDDIMWWKEIILPKETENDKG